MAKMVKGELEIGFDVHIQSKLLQHTFVVGASSDLRVCGVLWGVFSVNLFIVHIMLGAAILDNVTITQPSIGILN